jgi:hypothetical protein
MHRSQHLRLTVTLLLALAGCRAAVDDLPGEPGRVTGSCIDDACFEGAVCLSDLCVDPTGDTGGDDDDDDDDDDNGDTDAAESEGDDDDGDDETTGADDAPDSGSFEDDTGTDTAAESGDGLPNGEACREDAECNSGHCYVIELLGGVCGECKLDDDCEGGGCTMPNPLADPPMGSTCNDGALGDGCMSDAACAGGLVCAELYDVRGVFSTSTCSECETDDDCAGSSLCAPDLFLTDLTGAYRCVAPGSLALGDTCELDGSGDAQCDSGHCAAANVQRLLLVGVCSECEDSGDCGGAACEPPVVDAESVTPGMCE